MTINPPKTFVLGSSILLIAPFFLWGTAMVAMKGVLPHTTPLFVAGIRALPAGILVLLFAHFLGRSPSAAPRSQPTSLKAWLWIGLFSLVDAAMFQGFLAEGLARTGAGLGSVIIDSQPLAVALMSRWLFREVIGFWGWLGLGLGICGISLIGLPDEWFFTLWQTQTLAIAWDWQALLDSGEGLMLLASLSMAVGTILIGFVSRHVDPVIATGWSGHLDFLNKGKFINVSYNLKDIHQSRVDNRIFLPHMKWAEVIEEDAKKKLIKFRASHSTPRDWAKELEVIIKEKYSFATICQAYGEAIKEIL